MSRVRNLALASGLAFAPVACSRAATPGGVNAPEGQGTGAGIHEGPESDPPKGDSGEPFSRDAIDAEVRARLIDLRACYETRVEQEPELAGIVVARFVIGDDGRARDIELRWDGIDDAELAGCLTGVIETTGFPAAPSGEAIAVTYPFEFRPE